MICCLYFDSGYADAVDPSLAPSTHTVACHAYALPGWLIVYVVAALNNICDEIQEKEFLKFMKAYICSSRKRTCEKSGPHIPRSKTSQSSQSALFLARLVDLSHLPLLLWPLVPGINQFVNEFHRIASANPSGGTAASLPSLIGKQGPFSFFFARHIHFVRGVERHLPSCAHFGGRILSQRTNRLLDKHTYQLLHALIGRYPAILTHPLPP